MVYFHFFFQLPVEVSEFEHDSLHDDARATEKDTALRFAISQLASEFGGDSMLSLQRFFGFRRAPVISTGSLKLDLALGIGGLPRVSTMLIWYPDLLTWYLFTILFFK